MSNSMKIEADSLSTIANQSLMQTKDLLYDEYITFPMIKSMISTNENIK